jgi:prepilin-type N-terminal cleavage/methylation domain-containing protein
MNKGVRSMKKGFTLIELLIVIAILGTLAVVILLALNPVQQLARTRDSGRISTVTQLGHAAEAYATTRNGVYMPENGTWITTLVNAGEISTIPAVITASAPNAPAVCAENAQNGICYDAAAAAGTAPAVIYTSLESQSQNSRCTGNNTAYAAYSTADGRGGIVCANGGLNTGNLNFLP